MQLYIISITIFFNCRKNNLWATSYWNFYVIIFTNKNIITEITKKQKPPSTFNIWEFSLNKKYLQHNAFHRPAKNFKMNRVWFKVLAIHFQFIQYYTRRINVKILNCIFVESWLDNHIQYTDSDRKIGYLELNLWRKVLIQK
jgi:hypothetical protein